MTNEQKQALKKIVTGVGLVIFLGGPLTNLYSFEAGLLIAIAIWVIGLPVLTLLGFGVEDEGGEGKAAGKSSNVALIIVIVFLAIFAVFSLIAYSVNNFSDRQSKTETRSVSGFDRIELSGGGELIIDQTGKEALEVQAPESLIDKIDTRVEGNTLVLSRKSYWWFWPVWSGKVVYRLSVDNLSDIAVFGSGNVVADQLKADDLRVTIDGSGRQRIGLNVDSIVARISGSGTFVLSGKTRDEEIDISGSGSYDAKNLKAGNANVSISGSGDAIVNSKKSLDISINGSGRVQYLGSPEIDQRISGSGSIVRYR